MKRLMVLALTTLLSVSVFAGCGNSSKPTDAGKESANTSAYKDGKYKASFDNLDSHGWKAFTEIEVKDGKIAAVDFDYLNKDGKRKSEDPEYNKSMAAKSPTSPEKYVPQLEKALVDKQDIGKVDVVTGATHSTENFKTLAKLALENAAKGDTKEVLVPQTDVAKEAAYKDGKYKVSFDQLDTHGWKAFTEIEVKDGKIASVDFDYLNKDGKRKSEDPEYNKSMAAKSPTSPEKYVPQLEKALVDKQDIEKVDVVTGATHSTENFKTLAKIALENAAKGDTKEVLAPQPDVKK